MYITSANMNVKIIFDKIEKMPDIEKMKFLIYVFNLLNNNQINNKNEANPSLVEDDDLIVFNFESIGIENYLCNSFLRYNAVIFNKLLKCNDAIEENGNILGIDYESKVEIVISSFEKLSFNEKLDLIGELIIRYDNEAFFNHHIIPFNLEYSGYDIAKLIKDFKNKEK